MEKSISRLQLGKEKETKGWQVCADLRKKASGGERVHFLLSLLGEEEYIAQPARSS